MKKAFTLSEILITLGIIGVVAAITMPTLINNYKKHQTVNQLKKAYSEINQAIRMSEYKYGTIDTWDFADFETPAERVKYFTDNYLLPNIKVIKTCDYSNMEECWAGNIDNIDVNNTGKVSGLITSSGYSLLYWLHTVGNGGWFYIDINGPKKPNITGKDIFIFAMSWGNAQAAAPSDTCIKYHLGLRPSGLQCKSTQLSREELKTGKYCTALIMLDSWQISDDYPCW